MGVPVAYVKGKLFAIGPTTGPTTGGVTGRTTGRTTGL